MEGADVDWGSQMHRTAPMCLQKPDSYRFLSAASLAIVTAAPTCCARA